MSKQESSAVARWQALASLYDQACALDAGARRDLLDRVRGQDNDLHDQLRHMLAERDGLDSEAAELGRSTARQAPALSAGRGREGVAGAARVGPYRLLRRAAPTPDADQWIAIHEDGALRRPVLIQLPRVRIARGSRASAELALARGRERLAALRHPSLAALIDTGISQRGEPWFALDAVEGEPIDRWCDRHRLSPRARLLLLRQAVAAVQHGHGHWLPHGDIRPSKILVTPRGGVRVLDFGLALLLGDEGVLETAPDRPRRDGERARYASPERLASTPPVVASDVYSFGVVLYELLCGASPYEAKPELPAQLEQAVMGAAPRPPSERVDAEAAAARGLGERALRRELGGDLDAITLRCLAKSPTARYSSLDALLADIDRWLNAEPLRASAASLAARGAALVRRSKSALQLAVLGFVAIAAAAVAALSMVR